MTKEELLYPLSFTPILHYKLWGGDKLNKELNKQSPEMQLGESWELSQVSGNISVVSDGPLKDKSLDDLIANFKGEIMGESVFKRFQGEFPLLIKYIDAKAPLSIQVHPDNDTARERHKSFGKNEMWYIMQADSSSKIILGWEKELDEGSCRKVLKDGCIIDYMNEVEVSSGDVFYIPTGRVHAIGAGVLLAEIQQTSDITYRVYDYDRIDAKTGQKRELHIEDSLSVMNFNVLQDYKTQYELSENKSEKLVHSPYFKTNIIELKGEMYLDYTNRDSFTVYMAVEGCAMVNNTPLEYGATLFIPNALNDIVLYGTAKILEISIP